MVKGIVAVPVGFALPIPSIPSMIWELVSLLLNVPNIVGLCFLSAVKLEAKIFDYSSFIIVVIYHMTEEKVVVKAECCRPVDKLPVTLEKCFLLLNLGLHFLFGADISVITTPQSAYASLWECKIQPSESAVLLY